MRLDEAGLVEVFPQSGTIVSLIDVPLARQAQFLRRAIEQEAVRVLAEAPDGARRSNRLRAVIREQAALRRSKNLERFNDADLAFHKLLYEAAGVPDLWSLVRHRSGHIDRIRRLHLPIGGKADQIVRDHSAIVNAIEKGEPDRRASGVARPPFALAGIQRGIARQVSRLFQGMSAAVTCPPHGVSSAVPAAGAAAGPTAPSAARGRKCRA